MNNHNNIFNHDYQSLHEDEERILFYLKKPITHIKVLEEDKSGLIRFVDQSKLKYPNGYGTAEIEIRKPTPKEREDIIINYLIENKSKPINIKLLSRLLAVSERTIQSAFKKLENDNIIKRIANFNKFGKQTGNIIKVNIKEKPKLTIYHLYDPTNPSGIRNFEWEEYKVVPYSWYSYKDRQSSMTSYSVLKDEQKELEDKKNKFYKE